MNSSKKIFNSKLIRPTDRIFIFHKIQRIREQINQIAMRKHILSEGGGIPRITGLLFFNKSVLWKRESDSCYRLKDFRDLTNK